jgi:hypothetical protein
MDPIDALIAKALDTANLATLIPKVWASQIEPNLRKRSVFEPSVIENTDLLGAPGDIVHIPTLQDLSVAIAALTEGTPMTAIQLDPSTEVQFTPSEVGLTVKITRKSLDRLKYDGMSAILDRLAYAMSVKLNSDIAGLYNATRQGDAAVLSVLYPNGHASGTVVATDVFDIKTLLKGIAQLESADNIPFDDGFWRLYIHPQQYKDLIQDATIRNDLRYSEPEVLIRGEVGVFANTRIIVSTYVKSVTENTIPVYKSMLLAPRWAALAWKRRPEVIVDPTLYDLGRTRQFGVTADYQVGLLHTERALVITTAAS